MKVAVVGFIVVVVEVCFVESMYVIWVGVDVWRIIVLLPRSVIFCINLCVDVSMLNILLSNTVGA